MPKQPRNEAERKAYDAFVENLRREREKKAGREAKRTAKAKGETDAAQ